MGERMHLREAAEHLGISTRTARRWIKAGFMTVEMEHGRYGPEYLVSRDAILALQRERPYPTSVPQPRPEAILAHARELRSQTAELQQELHAASSELSRFRAELRALRTLIRQYRQEGTGDGAADGRGQHSA